MQLITPIYNMIWFADLDPLAIVEVYEQVDTMLSKIKNIVEPSDENL